MLPSPKEQYYLQPSQCMYIIHMVAEGFDIPRLDQTEAFWRLYDPRNTQKNLGLLVTHLCEKRQTPTNITTIRGLAGAALHIHPEPTRLSGASLIWAETTHASLASDNTLRHEFAGITGESAESLQTIETIVENDTELAARLIAEYIVRVANDDEQLETLSTLLGVPINRQTNTLVLAGLLLSFASHRGQFRQNLDENGQSRPYFSHPLATAILYQKSWNKTVSHIEAPDETWLHRQLFVNLMHDAFEDMIHKDPRQSFLDGSTLRTTPLLLYKVLIELGEDTQHATDIVRDLMLVTKTRGLDGKSQEPTEYVQQCTSSIRAMIAKFCDTVHNKIIDTKADKDGRAKTNQEYDTMLAAIHTDINRTMQDDFGHALLSNLYDMAIEFEKDHDSFMKHAANDPLGKQA